MDDLRRKKQNEYARRWRLANPEKVKAIKRKHYEAYGHIVQANYDAAHVEERRVSARKSQLAKYGLTQDMFDEFLDAQENACAYCGGELPKGVGRIAVDHDHVTGQVRGLVHIGCNVSIALAEKHFVGYVEAATGKVFQP